MRLKHLIPDRADAVSKLLGPTPLLDAVHVAVDTDTQETCPRSIYSSQSSPTDSDVARMFPTRPPRPSASPTLSRGGDWFRLDDALLDAGVDATDTDDVGIDGDVMTTDDEASLGAGPTDTAMQDAQPFSPAADLPQVAGLVVPTADAPTEAAATDKGNDVASAAAALPGKMLKHGPLINSNGAGHSVYLAFCRECKTVTLKPAPHPGSEYPAFGPASASVLVRQSRR